MEFNRRSFIKYVIAGSLVALCPIDITLRAELPAPPMVDGEHFDICHQLRDARVFKAATSARHDVAILGGGVSGLTAAYLLRDQDFILLEKEAHWGGNAYTQEYQGQEFATGAAFTGTGDWASQLGVQIGLKPLPIDSADGTIVNGVFVPDTWRSGLDQLAYPAEVLRGFKEFRQEMMRVPLKSRARELDGMALAWFLRGYPPELATWWDGFGRSNWGGAAAESSALIGIGTLQEMAKEGSPDGRVTFAGGLGAITKRLAAILGQSHGDRMYLDTTAVGVVPEHGHVRVTYMQQGAVKALEAKAVIVALPKFFARRIVDGLPAAQSSAMAKIQYAPYAVVNLIFDRPMFNSGYDTWCPGNAFTDFIVADWVIRNQPGYRRRNNILTCYTPLAQSKRAELLTEDRCRNLAARVLRDFQKLFPKSEANPIEVHFYRRGHPMMISAPGIYTQVLPVARRPMARIFFANTDSEGPVSSTDGAIAAAHRAVVHVRRLFAGLAAASEAIEGLPSLKPFPI
jgi:protoporphyrinogen oxidase